MSGVGLFSFPIPISSVPVSGSVAQTAILLLFIYHSGEGRIRRRDGKDKRMAGVRSLRKYYVRKEGIK